MEIIQFLQDNIYNLLHKNKNIQIENIFVTPKKNSSYPFLLIQVKNITDESNLKDDIFLSDVVIQIYDKNTSKTNKKLLDNAKSVIDTIQELKDINNLYYTIKNINFINANLEVFNEINTIWMTEIVFKIVVQKNGN